MWNWQHGFGGAMGGHYGWTMVAWGQVGREHVLAAIHEYDRLGQADFLDTHHFGPARQYLLEYGGHQYDSKAILGVAYQRATGNRVTAQDFSGGKHGAAKVLRSLGFTVSGPL
jgi:hypothetical protein